MDWSVLHLVNGGVAARDWLEDPVTIFSSIAVPLYAGATVGLWLLARPYGDARWKLACTSALTSAGIAMLANQVVAHTWDRSRPYASHPEDMHLLASPSADPSFPSDHAAAAFAVAFAVLAFSRRGGGVFLAVAASIGLSRIALGLHYPTDVLAGVVVGWASAVAVTGVGRRLVVNSTRLVSRVTDPVLARVWRLGHQHRTT